MKQAIKQTKNALSVVSNMLANSHNYTIDCEKTDDGYYKLRYKNLIFKDKEGIEHRGEINIAKCSVFIKPEINNLEGKISVSVIDKILSTEDDGVLFTMYLYD